MKFNSNSLILYKNIFKKFLKNHIVPLDVFYTRTSLNQFYFLLAKVIFLHKVFVLYKNVDVVIACLIKKYINKCIFNTSVSGMQII